MHDPAYLIELYSKLFIYEAFFPLFSLNVQSDIKGEKSCYKVVL